MKWLSSKGTGGARGAVIGFGLLVTFAIGLSGCGDIEDMVDAAERLEQRAVRAEAVLNRVDGCLTDGAIVEPGPNGTYFIWCIQ